MGNDILSQLSGLGFDVSAGEKERQKRDRENAEREKKKQKEMGGRSRGNARDRTRRGEDKYVGAPYNFVSQWDSVVRLTEGERIAHNELSEHQFSGEIQYSIKAMTDLVTADGEEQFTKNPYGEYVIPGSTVRGLIRSNTQILGMGSLFDDLDDYSLLFRRVANARDTSPDKDLYGKILGSGTVSLQGKQISVLKYVKAGYITKENGKYRIYRTKVDKINPTLGEINYYILSERSIQTDIAAKKQYPFYWKHTDYLQHNLRDGFREEKRHGRTHYIGTKNRRYHPYFMPVKYGIQGDRKVVFVGKSGDTVPDGILDGYAVGTGPMNEKKCHYIIPEIDKSKPYIDLSKDEKTSADIRAYEIDFNHKSNQLRGMMGEDISFFALPKEGEIKPVFYIETDKRVYFGFTPRLRLFYNHSTKEGLDTAHFKEGLDYARSMFGYAHEEDSYKSKLSFSDAVLKSGQPGKDANVILGGPSASSFNDYLETDDQGRATSYNQDGFRLRGIKQYWLREQTITEVAGKNDNVKSVLQSMASGAVFKGKIRFHNLTEEEYGLLLWSICLDSSSEMNIGKGKPYGFGRIKVSVEELRELDIKKAYGTDRLSLDPMVSVTEEERETYIDDKIKHFQFAMDRRLKELGIKGKLLDQSSIKDFFAMKDSDNMPEPEKIRYMSLDNREYQNRKPLPEVFDVLRKG